MDFEYLKGAFKKEGENVSSKACCSRTTGNVLKPKEGRVRQDMKNFFTMRVVNHWNMWPELWYRSLPIPRNIQGRSDGVVSNMIWLKMSLFTAGRVGLDDL